MPPWMDGIMTEDASEMKPIKSQCSCPRIRMWWQQDQQFPPVFVVERHTTSTQSVTGWGAICWDTRSSPVVLQSTFKARSYVDEIVTSFVLSKLLCHLSAINRQDNACTHTSRFYLAMSSRI
ncbi:hypothetical protein TNCV_3902431 [Trichonephila clavipes]|nr:hypothetical protein TNCV_3902431 [Trichonephila clavipes]